MSWCLALKRAGAHEKDKDTNLLPLLLLLLLLLLLPPPPPPPPPPDWWRCNTSTRPTRPTRTAALAKSRRDSHRLLLLLSRRDALAQHGNVPGDGDFSMRYRCVGWCWVCLVTVWPDFPEDPEVRFCVIAVLCAVVVLVQPAALKE